MTPELGYAAPGAHGSHVGFCTSAAISDTAMRGSGERALRQNALPGIPGIAQVPFVFLNVLSRALLQGLVCSEGGDVGLAAAWPALPMCCLQDLLPILLPEGEGK